MGGGRGRSGGREVRWGLVSHGWTGAAACMTDVTKRTFDIAGGGEAVRRRVGAYVDHYLSEACFKKIVVKGQHAATACPLIIPNVRFLL